MKSRVGSAAIGEATENPKEIAPIVKEGYLWKRGEFIRNWRERYYILRADGTFSGYKTREESLIKGEIQNDFKLQEDVTIIKQEKPKPNTFIVQGVILRGGPVDRMYYTDTPEDREMWVTAIQGVVEATATGDWNSCLKLVEEKEVRMYDISLLYSQGKNKQPFQVRPLQLSDYDRGFLELLSQEGNIGNISKTEFTSQFHAMKSSSDNYYVTVLEDTVSNRVISTATLVTELQFNHSYPKVGWIKDIVIDKDHADQQQLKDILLNSLKNLGEKIGCRQIEAISLSYDRHDGDV
ncbi:RAC-alpha serine/threonine-protein kinase-like [Saccostrea echinata]|uniref:RAC-alpha serine/threonine-protein kinase-like n=1 Tax=Saccostrea echinata TaxID=191078 RepID=UPI002A805752|nr:RAC-alpha serine/threonine-protein kinase-like [Saccostrea echinata]